MSIKSILLVEDERPKLAHIDSFLNSLKQEININHAMSVTSALESLEEELPDLLLLDMSLPTYDVGDRENGGRPQAFGGIEVLRHMSMADLICPTIIITGYEGFLRAKGPVDLSEFRSELENEFPEIFLGVLHFNSTFDDWKSELENILLKF